MRHVQGSVHFVQRFFFPFNVVTTRNMHHREPDRAVENILRKLQREDHGKCSVPLTLKPAKEMLSYQLNIPRLKEDAIITMFITNVLVFSYGYSRVKL